MQQAEARQPLRRRPERNPLTSSPAITARHPGLRSFCNLDIAKYSTNTKHHTAPLQARRSVFLVARSPLLLLPFDAPKPRNATQRRESRRKKECWFTGTGTTFHDSPRPKHPDLQGNASLTTTSLSALFPAQHTLLFLALFFCFANTGASSIMGGMEQDTIPLASLSLTHVYYDPHDKLSLVCAYLALLPQALCVVYASLFFSTREVEIGLAFAGQLACEALNFALKRLIKEERPPRIHGKGYGMPSSHAQFVAYWSVSLTLFLLLRHRPSAPPAPRSRPTPRSAAHAPWTLLQRLALSAATVGVAAAVAWSRVYLGYHTARQVWAGCAAGTLSAIGWFGFTAALRQTGWLAWGLENPIARALRIRDLIVEEDMCQAGWEKWEEKRSIAAQSRLETKTK
ncbi:putative dolichyldiphosphatase [Paramyrothecium foliicola]|nr:putative dolichyldiphosphatase [Paramyrothecium foliicola]